MHRIRVQAGVVTVVTGSGELDAYAADELTAALGEVDAASRIVADLTGVSFMDSTALGRLVRSVRETEERGGSMRVVLPETPARRIFEITSLDRSLPVAASLETAIGELTPDR